jgi:hypothetical protein
VEKKWDWSWAVGNLMVLVGLPFSDIWPRRVLVAPMSIVSIMV